MRERGNMIQTYLDLMDKYLLALSLAGAFYGLMRLITHLIHLALYKYLYERYGINEDYEFSRNHTPIGKTLLFILITFALPLFLFFCLVVFLDVS